MAPYKLSYKSLGNEALLVTWPAKINKAILEDVVWLQTEIEEHLSKRISETIPAYNSLLVCFDPEETEWTKLILEIQHLYEKSHSRRKKNGVQHRRWHIPVSYDEEYSTDLESVSAYTGLPPDEVVDMHQQAMYTVYFIGFLPGFLYLGGLPTALHTPRKAMPVHHIHKGTVAIGGAQTGIYPVNSPGGWNCIGSTPISLFDSCMHPPCFAMAGDEIQFFEVDTGQYAQVSQEIEDGIYQVKNEVI